MGLNGGSGSVPPCSSPIAREAAGIILAHEVERGLQGLLQQGQLLSGATLREVGHDVDADYPSEPRHSTAGNHSIERCIACPTAKCFGLVG